MARPCHGLVYVYVSVRVLRCPYRQRPDVTASSHNVSAGLSTDDPHADGAPNLFKPYRVSTPPRSYIPTITLKHAQAMLSL